VHRFLVEGPRVFHEPVVQELLPVVTDDHDQGVVGHSRFGESSEARFQRPISPGNLCVVADLPIQPVPE